MNLLARTLADHLVQGSARAASWHCCSGRPRFCARRPAPASGLLERAPAPTRWATLRTSPSSPAIARVGMTWDRTPMSPAAGPPSPTPPSSDQGPEGAAPRRDGALLPQAPQDRTLRLAGHGKLSHGLPPPGPGHQCLECGQELRNHAPAAGAGVGGSADKAG